MSKDIKNKKLIKYLYKFQNAENINHIKSILNKNLLYFSSPKKFNDPFDCSTLFSFEGANEDDFRTFYYNIIKFNEPSFDDVRIKQEVESIINSGDHKNHEKLLCARNDVLTFIEPEIKKKGILCLSEKNDDILMWSHYGNKHSGICLEFDKKIIHRTDFTCRRIN